jgi:alkylation response protein AidB-like acyl-CoA dehydrogenase
MDIVERAQLIADRVLFPRALETDAADVVPADLLRTLADARLYGLAGPPEIGGLDADFATVCEVFEALSSGCLTTAFVWAQHHGAVRGVANSQTPGIRERWLEPLVHGTVRAGVAGAAGAPLEATQTDNGWLFSGTAPWVSGWGAIDVVHAAGRTGDGRVAWGLIDPVLNAHLSARRLRLVGLNATATVTLEFRDYFVPDERITGVVEPPGDAAAGAVLRVHASFALGIIRRCCALIGPSPLDAELRECRAALDAPGADLPAARAAAARLAHRASGLLMVTRGSQAVLMTDPAQLLAREALFMLVYALRPAVKAALLEQSGLTGA